MNFFRLPYWSKRDKRGIRGSPVKNKPTESNGIFRLADVALKSKWSRSRSTNNFTVSDNREEAFFDSHPWLDSDYEDDFYSVNGDFTPSRGSTPCLSRTTSERNFSVSLTDPSLREKKKNLLELFRDSGQYDHSSEGQSTAGAGNRKMGSSDSEHESTVHDLPFKSVDCTPYVSGSISVCSSGGPVDGDSSKAIREKSMKSVECCFPGMVLCRNLSVRRKKASPVISVDGKSLI